MSARLVPRFLGGGPSPLDAIPGSDGHDELFHMLRDPTGFFHQRFERHGRLWKTRFVYPAIFAIGEDANKAILVTQREDFSFGRGYAATAVKRVFEGSIMLEDGEAHRRTRDTLSPAVTRLAVRECRHARDASRSGPRKLTPAGCSRSTPTPNARSSPASRSATLRGHAAKNLRSADPGSAAVASSGVVTSGRPCGT